MIIKKSGFFLPFYYIHHSSCVQNTPLVYVHFATRFFLLNYNRNARGLSRNTTTACIPNKWFMICLKF